MDPPSSDRGTHVVYAPADRPAVQVHRDGAWYPGELRSWRRDGDRWSATVTWSEEPGNPHLDTVRQDDVRERKP